MGRKRSRNMNLPPRMLARVRGRKKYYFYDTGGTPRREIALGTDYAAAIKKWAELHVDKSVAPETIMFRHAADRYQRDVIPNKAVATQRDNRRELAKLLEYFDAPPAPLAKIRPMHVRAYLDWRTDRGRRATVRANREKALFSHIWNKARQWGYTDGPNPCEGVDGYKETGRDVFIEDDVYRAVWEAADLPTREAMDLAHLTGQRPADVLKMDLREIRDGVVHVRQGKTGTKLRVEIVGALAALLSRIEARKRGMPVVSTRVVVNEQGQPLTTSTLRSRFDAARAAAGIEKGAFQFRDLRAKAATESEETIDMRAAQQLLGHRSGKMTEAYVRNRLGKRVKPTR